MKRAVSWDDQTWKVFSLSAGPTYETKPVAPWHLPAKYLATDGNHEADTCASTVSDIPCTRPVHRNAALQGAEEVGQKSEILALRV